MYIHTYIHTCMYIHVCVYEFVRSQVLESLAPRAPRKRARWLRRKGSRESWGLLGKGQMGSALMGSLQMSCLLLHPVEGQWVCLTL